MVCKAYIPQETIRIKAKNFTESTTDVLKSTRRTEIQLHCKTQLLIWTTRNS